VEQMLGITRFLRRPPIYLLLYGFVTCRRDEYPEESWQETILVFKKRFNIPDDVDCDSAMLREVFRMTIDIIKEGV